MKYTNQNLRELTIFDLTTDINIIVDEFGIVETSESYAEGLSIQTRIKDFLDLAKLTKDTKLKKAVHSQFEKELLSFGY